METPKRIFVIPYTHCDYSWTNSRAWHIARYIESYSELPGVMDSHPDFKCTIDNIIHSLEPFMQNAPEKFERFAALVKSGRLAIASGGRSLARPSQVCEESFVRNAAAGCKDFERIFGKTDMSCFLNADTGFGHSQLPQILRLCGHKYYHSNRPESSLDAHGVPRQFVWRGLDGSTVVASRGDYGGFLYPDIPADLSDDKAWADFKEKLMRRDLSPRLVNASTEYVAQFFGGDDGLPMRTLDDRGVDMDGIISEWNRREDSKLEYATLPEYFSELEKLKLPLWEGAVDECEISFNSPKRGNSSLRWLRFELDRALCLLESVSVLAAENGINLPGASELWNELFEITGHAMEFAIASDDERVRGRAYAALYTARERTLSALDELASRLAGENGYIIVNPRGEAADETVTLHITSSYGAGDFALYDASGKSLPYQITELYGEEKRYGFIYSAADAAVRLNLPPLSATVVRARVKETAVPVSGSAAAHLKTPRGVPADLRLEYAIETPALSVCFEDGKPVNLRANGGKHHPDRVLFDLKFVKTQPSRGWCFDFSPQETFAFNPEQGRVVHDGPAVYTYEVRGRVSQSEAVITYTLNSGDDVLKVNIELFSVEGGLDGSGYFAADAAFEPGAELVTGIPFGWEKRKPVKAEGFSPSMEVAFPGQFYAYSFVAAAGSSPFALLSGDLSTLFRRDENSGTVTSILNCCMEPPRGDTGTHNRWFMQSDRRGFAGRGYMHFSLGLSSCADPAALSAKVRALKFPALSARGYSIYAPKTPALSPVCLKKGAVFTSFVAENDALVARFYESRGVAGTLTAQISPRFSTAEKTDFLGNPLKVLEIKKNTLKIPVKAFEIVTLRLK